MIIEELSEKVASPSASVGTTLDWFIGSGIDEATLQALEDEDKIQKELATKESQINTQNATHKNL